MPPRLEQADPGEFLAAIADFTARRSIPLLARQPLGLDADSAVHDGRFSNARTVLCDLLFASLGTQLVTHSAYRSNQLLVRQVELTPQVMNVYFYISRIACEIHVPDVA